MYERVFNSGCRHQWELYLVASGCGLASREHRERTQSQRMMKIKASELFNVTVILHSYLAENEID